MGTSFVEYKGKGFWAPDLYLAIWLGALIEVIGHLSSPSEWLVRAQRDWHLQAVLGSTGTVSASLDKLVTTDEQTRILLALSEQALTLLARYERGIPADVANAMLTDSIIIRPPQWGVQDAVPTADVLAMGTAFIRLLKGELTPPTSSVRLYVVHAVEDVPSLPDPQPPAPR